MQLSRYIALTKNSLFNHKLLITLRFLLFAGIVYYLFQTLFTNQQLLWDVVDVKWNLNFSSGFLLIAAVLLMPINWLLEARKWQIIASKSNIKLEAALRGVLLGLTLDNIMPLGTGTISGRVLSLGHPNSSKSIPGIIAGQVIQSAVTLLFGLFGFWLVWLKAASLFHWQLSHTLLLVLAGSVLLIGLFFWRDKIVGFAKPLFGYSRHFWGQLTFLSFFRYCIFLVQFYLLTLVFVPDIELMLVFGCATWLFAARTFMPKVSNMERLGIRALAVVFFANLYSLPVAGMLLSVILLWLLNLAIPSFIGLFFYRQLRVEELID